MVMLPFGSESSSAPPFDFIMGARVARLLRSPCLSQVSYFITQHFLNLLVALKVPVLLTKVGFYSDKQRLT